MTVVELCRLDTEEGSEEEGEEEEEEEEEEEDRVCAFIYRGGGAQ